MFTKTSQAESRQIAHPKEVVPLIGQKLPNLKLEVFHEEKIKTVRLSSYRGKWLVLVFYPGDFTFICPTELEEMAGLYPKFQKLGAEVISVSTDSAYVHKAWHDQSPAIQKVTFPMAADPTGQLGRALGIYLEKEGVSLRASFIVSPDQQIKAYEIHHNDIGRHAPELLRKLQAAKFVKDHRGLVCPASWKPGEKTLKPGVDLVGKI